MASPVLRPQTWACLISLIRPSHPQQKRIHHKVCEVSSAMPSTCIGPLQGTTYYVWVFIFLTEGPQLVYILGPIKLGPASAPYLLPYFIRKVFQASWNSSIRRALDWEVFQAITVSDLEYNNDLLMFPSFLTSLSVAARTIFWNCFPVVPLT